jgi:2-iminobutanoate/2-iminopropanoate deaminase
MTKLIVSTADAPKPLAGYSQAVKAGGLVFVSAEGPFDAKTGEVVGETIQEQTAQCLRNIQAILRAAGSSLEKAVNATFMLDEGSDYAGMNEEWAKWFPADQPARQGAKLWMHYKGIKIAIALVAEE